MKRLKTLLAEAVRSAILTSSGKELPDDDHVSYNHITAMSQHLKKTLPHYTKADHKEAGDFHQHKSIEHERNYLKSKSANDLVRSSRSATIAAAHHAVASDMGE